VSNPVKSIIVPIERILVICLPFTMANSPVKGNKLQYTVADIGSCFSISIPTPILTIGAMRRDTQINPAIMVSNLRYLIPAAIKKMPTMNSHIIKIGAKILQVNIPNTFILPPICGFLKNY
jgi:hypothetical protein